MYPSRDIDAIKWPPREMIHWELNFRNGSWFLMGMDAPEPSRAMIYMLAASGLFECIRIIRDQDGLVLVLLNRADQAAFVADQNLKWASTLQESLKAKERA